MEENYIEESVKKRLILAGLKELESHGTVDFSLRRVALSAEVSCAAPYRHFKSREDLIEAIISYIKEQWLLMCHTIEAAIPDLDARVRALCVSYIRFWIGNPNFRGVLFLSDHADVLGFAAKLTESLLALAKMREKEDAYVKDLRTTLLTLVYGSVFLMLRGELAASREALDQISEKIGEALS
ncbi:MAG: TetR/AcrR family transcriptional regulator [Clostridia bacterium]|nr:TetR/AcrR family transcriptional regulator [Clostridia bacterium]